MDKRTPNNTLATNQNGLVAIFTTMMVMAILTLLTLGFTYSTNQAVKRTLGDQLNTQAYYAAESGVNAARDSLRIDPSLSKTECLGGGFNYDLDATLGIRNTCLLVDSNPTSISYDVVPVVGTGEPIITEVEIPAAAGSVQISWDSTISTAVAPGLSYTPSYQVLRPSSTWGTDIGMLRIDLVPIGLFDRSSLVTSSFSFFTYPTSAVSANTIGVSPTPQEQGGMLAVRCNNGGTYRCVGYVTPSVAHTRFLVRMTAYYNPVRVDMQFRPNNTNSGAPLEISRSQATIDSTGEASGVFRRIQVRVPILQSTGYHPGIALESADSICKRVIGAPPAGDGTGGSFSETSLDPACDAFN